jgi:leukotriene-A4 hydrolase
MKFLSFALRAASITLGAPSLMPVARAVVAGTFGSSQDPSSYGNVDQFQPLHLEMDYAIDFDAETTFGTITHTMTVLESAMDVYFDVWDAVEVFMAEFLGPNSTDFVEVEFNISTPNPNIGNALGVALPVELDVGEMFYIRFTYMSLPATTALDWLSPAMTDGKTMPFVYR